MRRRTPLHRSRPLERGGSLLRRTAIRKVSKKRTAENRVRAQVIARLGAERGPDCELAIPGVCTGRWQHGHEILSRARGGSITDEANILLACDGCNGWVADNPFEASVLGLSKWSWEDEAA